MATAEEIAQRDAEDSIEQAVATWGKGHPSWRSVDQNVIERMFMIHGYMMMAIGLLI